MLKFALLSILIDINLISFWGDCLLGGFLVLKALAGVCFLGANVGILEVL
jgi:hypothetical protein